MASTAKTAAILGLDTAAGAYLARLLGARGYIVRGTGGPALLMQLGVADDVARPGTVADAIAGAGEIYDLRGDAAAAADVLALGGGQRLFVAVDPGDEPLIATLAAARTDRFVATGRVYPHESRLGPGTSPVARIVAAAAADRAPDPADLASATDCGWTPEYVDAMWRLLHCPRPLDATIATGRTITGTAVAAVASRWFGHGIGDASPATTDDTRPADLGAPPPDWRPVTWGPDLVTVLCEGMTSARGATR